MQLDAVRSNTVLFLQKVDESHPNHRHFGPDVVHPIRDLILNTRGRRDLGDHGVGAIAQDEVEVGVLLLVEPDESGGDGIDPGSDGADPGGCRKNGGAR